MKITLSITELLNLWQATLENGQSSIPEESELEPNLYQVAGLRARTNLHFGFNQQLDSSNNNGCVINLTLECES